MSDFLSEWLVKLDNGGFGIIYGINEELAIQWAIHIWGNSFVSVLNIDYLHVFSNYYFKLEFSEVNVCEKIL